MKITKYEFHSLCDAYEYVNNTLENCIADENSVVVRNLKKTLKGLNSLMRKHKKQQSSKV